MLVAFNHWLSCRVTPICFYSWQWLVGDAQIGKRVRERKGKHVVVFNFSWHFLSSLACILVFYEAYFGAWTCIVIRLWMGGVESFDPHCLRLHIPAFFGYFICHQKSLFQHTFLPTSFCTLGSGILLWWVIISYHLLS